MPRGFCFHGAGKWAYDCFWNDGMAVVWCLLSRPHPSAKNTERMGHPFFGLAPSVVRGFMDEYLSVEKKKTQLLAAPLFDL